MVHRSCDRRPDPDGSEDETGQYDDGYPERQSTIVQPGNAAHEPPEDFRYLNLAPTLRRNRVMDSGRRHRGKLVPKVARSRRRASMALTGTPGSGKSRVATELGPNWGAVEVGDLAVQRGFGRRGRGTVRVDLRGLRRSLAANSAAAPGVLVGHLAHLMPVEGAIVLRCHPLVLRSRLVAASRGTPADRQENYVAEAIDLVAREARERRLPVWEIDTTRRTPRSIAHQVERILRDRTRVPGRPIDWLADPRVTAHLLDRPS
jgi:adenylate kinase